MKIILSSNPTNEPPFDLPRGLAMALLATGAVKQYVEPPPKKPVPNTNWGVRNIRQSSEGIIPPAIQCYCQACGSHGVIEGPALPKADAAFKHNNPEAGRVGCDVSEPIPDRIRKMFEAQVRMMPSTKAKVQSELERKREENKMWAVRMLPTSTNNGEVIYEQSK